LLILTKEDLISFRVKNLTSFFEKKNNIKPNIPQLINRSISSNMLDLNQEISTHNNICVQFANQVYKVDNLVLEEPMAKNIFLVGEFIFYGDKITETIGVPQGGQVVHLNSKKLTIRRGQSIFLSSKAILHAYNGDLIDKNYPVVTLPYQKLKAGDIVQGIPKIEQFFEARITRRGRLFRDSIPNLLRGLFKLYKSKYSIGRAVRQSLYKIQQILVDGVQRVYRSQGVTIADKHIEIIVKQMTSKVKIINGGQTGFFPGELVDLEFVEQINNILMKKIYYEPLVLGITKASLEVDSFLSAASFQQTTRVLSKAAISKKKDFLKGLKENVIVGNLIPAGTGYLIYLQDLEKLRFKNIFLRKSNV
jgi:DNA-directed RNA polymerase subunit beta'